MQQPAATVKLNDKSYLWHPAKQMAEYVQTDPVIFQRGEGYRLWDVDGREYIDANSGVWCVHLGYSHKRLIEAATRQLERLPYANLSAFSHEPAAQLAERLAKLAPDPPVVFSWPPVGQRLSRRPLRWHASIFGRTARRLVTR